MSKRSGEYLVGWVVTIILVVLFFRNIDVEQVFATIGGARPVYMAIGVGAIFAYMFIFVRRWQLILTHFKHTVPFNELVKIMFFGALLGDFTPSRIGYFTKVYQTKKLFNVPYDIGLYTTALDKFYDIVITAILAVFGLWLIGREFNIGSASLMVPLVILFLVIIFGFFFLRNSAHVIRKFAVFVSKKHMFPARVRKELHVLSHEKAFPGELQLRVITLSLLVRLMRLFVAYFFLLSLGAQVNVWILFLILSVGDVLLFTPLTISGLGIVEAYAALIFPTLLGISVAQAAAYALLYRFWTIAVHGSGVLYRLLDIPKE